MTINKTKGAGLAPLPARLTSSPPRLADFRYSTGIFEKYTIFKCLKLQLNQSAIRHVNDFERKAFVLFRLDLWKHVIVSSARKQMSYHCCCGSLVLSFLFMALLRLYEGTRNKETICMILYAKRSSKFEIVSTPVICGHGVKESGAMVISDSDITVIVKLIKIRSNVPD
ncbi:unnamed protein product [Arabidopsis lyrata]|uniref:Predicted protein n=1 Tax=Arabidopsis lyrata subsp. lyrata TaxID=81972 RepID=D7KD19_ARALL|nr:predicted protein [Arabidopsis lyrata subsp. lyrata]CAH8254919.1 unnamed protein product [Arabidopsis lyrata]